MYIHEVNYQKHNPSNRQERYLKIDSWKLYLQCLNGEYETVPRLKVPDGFTINKQSDTDVTGCWKHKIFYDDLIHYAHIINYENIPYGVYIAEVKVTMEV